MWFRGSLCIRIPAHPPPHARAVLPVLVLTQAGDGTTRLSAEAVGEGIGQIAGLNDDFPERAILVMGGDGAIGGEVLGDVTVGVVGRVVGFAVMDFSQQAADSASTLEGTGEVEAPDVEVCECVGL